MKIIKKYSLRVLLLLLIPFQAHATLIIDQQWTNTFDSNLIAVTRAVLDDSSLTGTGSESILVETFTLTIFLNNIGQSFEIADFNEPRDLMTPGNSAAQFNNGVFQFISNITGGGNGTITMRNQTLAGPISSGIAFNPNIGLLIQRFPISGERRFALDSTEITNVPEVPIPAAVWLFGSALLGLVGYSRRKANA